MTSPSSFEPTDPSHEHDDSAMEPDHPYRAARPKGWRRWVQRFADAFDGIRIGFATQENLWVQSSLSVVAILLGMLLGFEAWRWAVLLLCIMTVISLELMNSAIEQLVKVIHPEKHPGIARTLHLAAAAVLVAAMGSVIIAIFLYVPLVIRFFTQE